MHVSLNVCFSIRLVITRYYQMRTIVYSWKNVCKCVGVSVSEYVSICVCICVLYAYFFRNICDKTLPTQTSWKQL